MKLTKSKLKEMIEEELEMVTQEATALKSTWPGSSESLMSLAPVAKAIGEDLGVDQHTIAAELTDVIINNIYKPRQSSLEEGLDMMDQNVLEGMLQIMNNFGIVSWPALAAAFGMTVVELKNQLKSYAAKKAGVNIKTQ